MRSRSVVLVIGLAVSGATLDAQQCVGVPKGTRGFFTAGVAGADGASGTGLSFAYGSPHASLLVDRSEIGVFAHANAQDVTTILGSMALRKLRGCLTFGASYMGWDTEGREWIGWSADDPGHLTEMHTIGANYSRLRVPVGLSFGRTIPWKRVTFTPFINPFVVYERESLASKDPNNTAAPERRSQFGGGLTTGITLRAGWFTMQPSISFINTRDRALSGRRNGPELSLRFGVVF